MPLTINLISLYQGRWNLKETMIVFSNEDGYYNCKGNIGDILAISALGFIKDTVTCNDKRVEIRLNGMLSEAITIYGSRRKELKLNVSSANLLTSICFNPLPSIGSAPS